MRTGVNVNLKRFSVYWFYTPQGAAVPLPHGFPRQAINGVEEIDGKVWALGNAHPISATAVPSERVLLYPYIQEQMDLDDGVQITIHAVASPSDLLGCRQLPHYLDWPTAGMYICAKSGTQVVGALVLSRLVRHMRPWWRRKLEEERGKELEALWVRRIAVAENFQNRMIGSFLAKVAVDIARSYWLPKPDIVELVSRNKNHNFLLRSGFTLDESSRRGSLKLSGCSTRASALRYYYWSEVAP